MIALLNWKIGEASRGDVLREALELRVEPTHTRESLRCQARLS